MSSKPGRNLQSWMKTPEGRLCKTVVCLCENISRNKGLHGKVRRESTCLMFERLVPYHQDFWEQPRSWGSIYGRAINTHKNDNHEHPAIDKKLQAYLPLATELVHRNQPWSKEEFLAKLKDVGLPQVPPKSKRNNFSPAVKRIFALTVSRHGGWCPCCHAVIVANGENHVSPAEYDHYYSVQQAKLTTGWLICKKCHDDLTHGRMDRTIANRKFEVFQEQIRVQNGGIL
jgi:hypothetical protein